MTIGLTFDPTTEPLAGVDLARERHTRRIVDTHVAGTSRPVHDSAVVAGNGIGALSFAALVAATANRLCIGKR